MLLQWLASFVLQFLLWPFFACLEAGALSRWQGAISGYLAGEVLSRWRDTTWLVRRYLASEIQIHTVLGGGVPKHLDTHLEHGPASGVPRLPVDKQLRTSR